MSFASRSVCEVLTAKDEKKKSIRELLSTLIVMTPFDYGPYGLATYF
jgi:hypothetical protein